MSTRIIRRSPSTLPVLRAIVALLFMVGATSYLLDASEPPKTTNKPTPTTVSALLEAAHHSVVSIAVEREKGSDVELPLLESRLRDEESKAFFSRPDGYVTGLLLDSDGYVLTSNYNVYGKLVSIRVTLANGKSFGAKLVARSVRDDIALLKIERDEGEAALNAPTIRWAAVNSVRAGQIVFALGRSPDPSRPTVTKGIVSTVKRNGGRAVQTDAELNYGNVGGPLINLNGAVVALSCFVGHNQPQWGVNSGVGFGTTAATIERLLPRLKEGNDIKPALLGVLWDRKERDTGTGIERVVDDSPAAKAGLRAGDILLALDGETLRNFDHLRRLVLNCFGGQKVRVKVQRGEKILEVEATLGERS